MTNEITDEMKLALAAAISKALTSELFLKCQPDRGDVFSFCDDKMPELSGAAAQAACDYLAPRLRAQGMREAAIMFASDSIKHDSDVHRYVVRWYDRILARAAELEKEQGNA